MQAKVWHGRRNSQGSQCQKKKKKRSSLAAIPQARVRRRLTKSRKVRKGGTAVGGKESQKPPSEYEGKTDVTAEGKKGKTGEVDRKKRVVNSWKK